MPDPGNSVSGYLESLFGLSGQTAVVIGGAGALGSSFCRGLAAAGAHVVIAGRDEDRAQELVAELETDGLSVSSCGVDVSDPESMRGLADQVLAKHATIDMLINGAGINDGTPYEDISLDAWEKVLRVNLTGTHLGCQVFAPLMAGQTAGGAILNIGSVTAHLPLSRVFAYSASKAAVINLTKNVAREYATRGVRVNAICPGFLPAEQNRKLLDAQRTANIIEGTPMQRFGSPEELIGAILLLLGRKAASYITGSVFYVDGGFTAARF
jgi:NAD(P)-dependent dehydrogenase (short-subunit alcohol dehydrogenase family)